MEIIDKIKNNIEYIIELKANELERVLIYASDKYYNSDTDVISDELFDTLKDRLEKIKPTSKFFKQIGSPILKINQDRKKIKLPYYMGSLDKIKQESTILLNWLNEYSGPYIISDKLDGVSALLYKQNGKCYLYTRGNGTIGQDITHLIPYVINKNVLLGSIENGYAIRGELIITKQDFIKINKIMANARNAVSGLVNSKISSINENIATITSFVPYAILYPEMKQGEQMVMLKEMKFETVYYECHQKITIEKLSKILLERRKNSIYEVDGIVIIDGSNKYTIQKENPKYGFAFKQVMDDQIAIVDVIGVIWQTSMDGYLKPRIEIKPVSLTGVTITYVTGFNAKYIIDNVIGPGSKLKLVRSGDVIPYILDIISKATNGQPDLPNVTYRWNDTNIDIILDDINDNANKNVTVRKLDHFFKTMEIKYISEGILTKLVEAGYDDIKKILTAPIKDIEKIKGIGTKLFTKIINSANEKMGNTTLYTLMASSRSFSRGFGERKIKLITDKYPNILNNKWTNDEFIENIKNIDGFDIKTATQFVDNFQTFINYYNELNEIYDLSYLTKIKDIKNDINSNNLFNGKTVVFTGFRDSELEKKVIDNGGKMGTSVSSKTHLVVCIDENENSSKIKDAKKHNIKIITKNEFMALFN